MYRDAGNLFHAFLIERTWPTDPVLLEKRHVEMFIIWLHEERKAAPATVRARFAALRRFFNYLVEDEEKEIETSPMVHLHTPTVETVPPPVLTDDEQRRLLAACKPPPRPPGAPPHPSNQFDEARFEALRDRALLRLMLDTGMRRAEVAGIKVTDLNREDRVIVIMGKGSRPRPVYFGERADDDLRRYLRARKLHPLRALEYLWLAHRGQLTGDGIHHLVGRRARQAGLDHVFPHQLRHSFAHVMKSTGSSDEDVMTLGGWRDRKSMQGYGAAAAQTRAQATHRRLSPGDRI
jgi:site-specific recombinase XerD